MLPLELFSIANQGRRHVICDSFWSFSDARVACRSLGYSPYGN